MWDEFKKFMLRGNVVDLAVAVVVGAAFTGVVNALVRDVITPLLAAIGGKPDFARLSLTINKSTFMYGDFLNAVLSFAIVAAVIFLFVVQPVNKLTQLAKRRAKREEEEEAAKEPQVLLLEEIRDLLKKGGKRG